MAPSSTLEPDDEIRQLNDAKGSDLARSAEFQGLAELRNLIDQHFSLEEIQTLCFDMHVEFEHLAGNTRPLKIQNLIVYLAQRQLLPDLLNWLQQQRPNVSWELAQSAHWPPLPAAEPSESVVAFAAERPGRMTQYLDFEVEVGEGIGQDYPVNVIRSPAGEARETMHFPYDELALENRLQSLQIALLHAGGGQRQMLTAEELLVQEFGRDLFNALFTGEARSRFDVSCAEARQQGKGLRMKLRILPPEMARLPWEFLYDPRRAEYICLSRETPIIRYLELPQSVQPLEVIPPLRILGMTVSPSDLPRLDVPREKQRVEMALRPLQVSGAVQLTWLSGTTWRDLHRAMRAGPWHIFHFIGHGGFDSQADEGFIALADEKGLAQRLLATELGRLLADHYSLRLVLLNSCEGARGSEHDIFSSAAAILVRRGLPAVLAMQYTITDRAAIEFSRAFYEAMVDNLPVDAAVAEARKAVSLAKTYTVEWGTPVLFMRAPKGVIFNIRTQSRTPLAEAPETDDELERRLDQLYTDGLGAYWVEDWDKACRCFQSILDVRPAYVDASDRLAEAQRQQKLAALYKQAEAAGEDWPVAIAALEELVADMADYRDAQSLLATARQQKQLAEFYTEAHRLWEAGQWQAVVNVFGQIYGLEPGYPDPEGLLATAEQELVEVKRQDELNKLYGRAVRELDAGNWDEARLLLANIAEMEPDYRDTERLLARADEAAAQAEAERQKQAQVATWYEQALGLAQAAQWPQVLAKMQEIWTLDPDFADPEGLNGQAQAEIERAETEAARQTELAALYAEAVNLLKAQEYQAALDKWREVQILDPRYRDRQKVQRTAKKKLRQLNQTEKPGRRLDKRLLWLVPLAAGILIAVALLLLNPFDGGVGQELTPSSMAVVASGSCPEISGWQAEYWDNRVLMGNPDLCQDVGAVSFSWGEGSPGPGIPADNFSARYTRTVYFPEGLTRFTLGSDDGSRLWIDDVLLIDQWIERDYVEAFTQLPMSEGDHDFRVESFEGGGRASIRLRWAAVEDCAPGVIYCEDFENGDAPGWSLQEGWRVGLENGDHVLQGENHHFAILNHQGWEDYRLRFRLKLQQGGIHLNFRYSEDNTRYFVSFNESWLQLDRQRGPNPTNIVTLARAIPTFSLDRWYDVEIVGDGGHIQVFVDGNLELEFRDNDPVLRGSISFETLDDSSAQIDDVEVLPIQSQD